MYHRMRGFTAILPAKQRGYLTETGSETEKGAANTTPLFSKCRMPNQEAMASGAVFWLFSISLLTAVT